MTPFILTLTTTTMIITFLILHYHRHMLRNNEVVQIANRTIAFLSLSLSHTCLDKQIKWNLLFIRLLRTNAATFVFTRYV